VEIYEILAQGNNGEQWRARGTFSLEKKAIYMGALESDRFPVKRGAAVVPATNPGSTGQEHEAPTVTSHGRLRR